MKTLTRETYSKRVERVLDYLSLRIDEALDIHRLAEEAFLSPHHFHRVYVAMMGETLAEAAFKYEQSASAGERSVFREASGRSIFCEVCG
jgi:AraC family transcriptional regulator